ncbi:hypothetical protein RchiOBHm_Chr1g0314141 [Rosa chinensis]|uniref:Uncharacterized protein n=1 Tax=Rosa chinensis TaxID=74649 RepID=A0A2P6S727_ROSCH|nr:hypothetical protein RchiOBHm_Chr1g0314141 [Rosa chinensis]
MFILSTFHPPNWISFLRSRSGYKKKLISFSFAYCSVSSCLIGNRRTVHVARSGTPMEFVIFKLLL